MSPRGGPRKGAGRPPTKGEKRTVHLGGVHVTPRTMARYKRAARLVGSSFTKWAELALNFAAARDELTNLSAEEIAINRRLEKLHERLDAAIERDDEKAQERIVAEIDRLHGETDGV